VKKVIEIENQRLQLLPHKALLWEERSMLVVSDLHIGKASHFRKSGIPVPGLAETNNLWRLSETLLKTKPQRVVFLGDLFHSFHNSAWEVFTDFLDGFPETRFSLVKGNHDILEMDLYTNAGMDVVEELREGPFLFSHDRVESELFNFHGHIHPGVRLRGKGRQSIVLPCFFFGKNYAVLPSFGDFTGLCKLAPKKTDKVYVIAEDLVIEMA
jgi:DNA ligase-associated metallophosphoesterase